jgi:hypothetical protein
MSILMAFIIHYSPCFFMEAAHAVTPQQLHVIKEKDGKIAEMMEEQGKTTYEKLAPTYHQSVQRTLKQLDTADQSALKYQETQLPETVKNVREANRDVSDAQVKDMNILWQSAVYRNQPIRYAIEKLSHRDASGKPSRKKQLAKKALNGVAQVGGAAASLATASPIGIVSGAFVSDVLAQTSETTQKPVTDADMVILARAVETLQAELLSLYTDFKQAQAMVALKKTKVQMLESDYAYLLKQQTGSNNSKTTTGTIVNSLPNEQTRTLLRIVVDDAHRELRQAEDVLAFKRHALGLKVGPEALALLQGQGI